jgi:hypothetical protein
VANRTPVVLLAGCLLISAVAACDSSTAKSASASPSGSETRTPSTDTHGPGSTSAANPGSGTPRPSRPGTATAHTQQPGRVSFGSLIQQPQRFLGRTAEVLGKVFFVANCPPPGGVQDPCVLVGYLADPSTDHLLPGQLGHALPLVENDRAVSCLEPTADHGACPGWQQAARYRITGTVRNRVLGGRTTKYFELVVRSKARV